MKNYLLTFLCLLGSVFSGILAAENPYDADFIVALDGSGDFVSIQAAINAVPANSERRTVIYIKEGFYDTEKLIVPSNKPNVTIIGESRDNTIISYHMYDCSSGKCPQESYELWKDNSELIRTSATLTIAADGFIIENLTIENTAGPVGQALAITVTGDKGIYRNCNILGYQDTIYLWTSGKRSYFENCLVVGRTDYIYGGGIGYFYRCEIRSWGGGWITAPSTAETQKYGFVFNECQVTYADGSPRNGDDGATFALGRPWNNYPKVSWLYCDFSNMLNPLGWPTTWNMTYAATDDRLVLYEYKNTGTTADMSKRANWVGIREMTDAEALNYTIQQVMAGTDNWDPSAEAPSVQTYTWTGLGADDSWLNADNWNPVGVPAKGESATIEGNVTVLADGNRFEADLILKENAVLLVTADSYAEYISLSGGEIQATGNASLDGRIAVKAASSFTVSGELMVRASVSGVNHIWKKGAGKLVMAGSNEAYYGMLTISKGTLEAGESNSMGGGEIVVGSGTSFIVNADNALSVKAVLRIENGAKMVLNHAVVLEELYINGVIQEPGVYNATTHPDIFSGSQSVTIGRPTLFVWNPTENKRWGNAANYKPALLPVVGDTVSVSVEMEADEIVFDATILLKESNIRLVKDAVATGEIVMSQGTKFTYSTSGTGFSLHAPVKVEGDIILQMSGSGAGNEMVLSGNIRGEATITAYNYANADHVISRAVLQGDNRSFTGTWTTMASRVATSSAAFEGKSAHAFGAGKIEIGAGHLVYFSHAQAAGSENVLILSAGAKAVLNTDVIVGSLTLGDQGYTSGTFSQATHPEFFEGTGILTVTPTSVYDIPAEDIQVTYNGTMLIFSAPVERIEVYDLIGKQLYQQVGLSDRYALALSEGIYLVRVEKEGRSRLLKVRSKR